MIARTLITDARAPVSRAGIVLLLVVMSFDSYDVYSVSPELIKIEEKVVRERGLCRVYRRKRMSRRKIDGFRTARLVARSPFEVGFVEFEDLCMFSCLTVQKKEADAHLHWAPPVHDIGWLSDLFSSGPFCFVSRASTLIQHGRDA